MTTKTLIIGAVIVGGVVLLIRSRSAAAAPVTTASGARGIANGIGSALGSLFGDSSSSSSGTSSGGGWFDDAMDALTPKPATVTTAATDIDHAVSEVSKSISSMSQAPALGRIQLPSEGVSMRSRRVV